MRRHPLIIINSDLICYDLNCHFGYSTFKMKKYKLKKIKKSFSTGVRLIEGINFKPEKTMILYFTFMVLIDFNVMIIFYFQIDIAHLSVH